jgi:hypothetical protein
LDKNNGHDVEKLKMVDFCGVLWLIGKLINSTIDIDRKTLVLPKIYGLEMEWIIVFSNSPFSRQVYPSSAKTFLLF